jgi:hypothetical protein
MYKTVEFNIFEEHLEDIVYAERKRARKKETDQKPAAAENNRTRNDSPGNLWEKIRVFLRGRSDHR